jgi:hypothetical protein
MDIALTIGLVVALATCAWLLRERWRLAAQQQLALGRQSDLEAARNSFQTLAGESDRAGSPARGEEAIHRRVDQQQRNRGREGAARSGCPADGRGHRANQ